jgi:hypothetical protein
MEDKNEKSSKKHTASDFNGIANIGDDNPSKLKKRRTSSEGAATATPVHDREGNNVPVLNRCVLMSTTAERIIVPPPPPTSPPPKQTSAFKCLFIGPCEKERTAFIQSFVHRGNDNGQNKLATATSSSPFNRRPKVALPSPPSSSTVWSTDYSKKEYSYQNLLGDSSTVLLQFYNVSCKIDETQSTPEKQHPPSAWKSLSSSLNHVVLVLSLHEQLTDDTKHHLARTIETWKAWMDSQCAPYRSSGYPISLLLTTTTAATPTGVDKMNNSCGVASPSTLIRLGAALEIACQKYDFLNWYLLDLSNKGGDNHIGKDTDSMDEIIQSLVESTKAVTAAVSTTSTRPTRTLDAGNAATE